MKLKLRSETVDVVRVGDPMGAMKSLTLRVVGCVDPARVGTELTMLVPASFDVDASYTGTALWLGDDALPKLVLGPKR